MALFSGFILGIEQEDGSIRHTSTATVTSIVIPRGADNPENTWKYIKWDVSPAQQKRMARESLAVNANPTVKYNSANVEAILGQAWTDVEKAAISEAISHLVGIREYPGNYIISTYVNAAFMRAYSLSSDASDELLDRIIYINKEISRKRDDFKMDYFDVSTGEYHPGRYIAEPIYTR